MNSLCWQALCGQGICFFMSECSGPAGCLVQSICSMLCLLIDLMNRWVNKLALTLHVQVVWQSKWNSHSPAWYVFLFQIRGSQCSQAYSGHFLPPPWLSYVSKRLVRKPGIKSFWLTVVKKSGKAGGSLLSSLHIFTPGQDLADRILSPEWQHPVDSSTSFERKETRRLFCKPTFICCSIFRAQCQKRASFACKKRQTMKKVFPSFTLRASPPLFTIRWQGCLLLEEMFVRYIIFTNIHLVSLPQRGQISFPYKTHSKGQGLSDCLELKDWKLCPGWNLAGYFSHTNATDVKAWHGNLTGEGMKARCLRLPPFHTESSQGWQIVCPGLC